MAGRGQMIGQVLVFILAGLVFVLIIAYGYKAIQGFAERSEQVSLVEIRNDLERSVSDVLRQYGSVRRLDLRVPIDYQGVCIVDPDECPSQVILPLASGDVAVDWIVSACEARTANVFLVPRGLDLYLPDISVPSPHYVCAPNLGGVVSLRLEGMGREVKVSEW